MPSEPEQARLREKIVTDIEDVFVHTLEVRLEEDIQNLADDLLKTFEALFTTHLQAADYNVAVVGNVTNVARAKSDMVWVEPVSGKKLYNEAHLQAVREAVEGDMPAKLTAPPIPKTIADTFNNAVDQCKAALDRRFEL